MKKYITIICFLGVTLLFEGCYHENSITSDFKGDTTYSFPQGSDEWDKDLEQIYKDYGVKVIYRNLTAVDYNRSWLGSSLEMQGSSIPEEKIKAHLSFIMGIFHCLPPEITKGVFPIYLFMGYNVHSSLNGIPALYGDYYEGMGFWIKCLEVEPFEYTVNSRTYTAEYKLETKEDTLTARGNFIRKVIDKSITKGLIDVPGCFKTDFDYSTATSTSQNTSNFYKLRGFPGQMRIDENFNFFPLSTITMTNPTQNFFDYICFCLRYADDSEELEQYAPAATYPMLHTYRKIVQEYMLETYGVDLNKIASNDISAPEYK